MRRRSESGVRRVTLTVFEASGRAISEVRSPHRKRVTPDVLDETFALMQPGDVIVTRHQNAMSNLFLPGYWPHAALYIGDEEERRALGVEGDLGQGVCILESKKDGVRFREIAETLSVDAFCVLRPPLTPHERATAIRRVSPHIPSDGPASEPGQKDHGEPQNHQAGKRRQHFGAGGGIQSSDQRLTSFGHQPMPQPCRKRGSNHHHLSPLRGSCFSC